MQDQGRNKRRNYFIDKSFQTKFILKFCLLIASASLLTGIFIYWFNRQTTTVAFENLKVVVKSTSDFVLPIMSGVLVAVIFLAGIATIAITLFTSHKIAGPLYRLKVELTKIKSGDLSSTIRIRAEDQLQKVASEFEDLRLVLKGSIGTLRENWKPIKISLEKLKDKIKDEKEKEQIQDNIDKIDAELVRFKTD